MSLLERGDELAVLGGVAAQTLTGAGTVTAISGEPGAGKSSLVAALRALAGMRVLRAGCDPLSTPRPLGPFRDLADDRPGPDSPGLETPAPIGELFEQVYAWLAGEPTMLVVEDVHWLDGASGDVLRLLVRRIEAVPCAVVVTYREDEIGDRHPARALLGDIAAAPRGRTLRLKPLSVGAVAELLAGTELDPEQVHGLTGGNPFFVAEVAKEADRPLPRTVRDAVLARIVTVAPEDLEVLQLAAAAPDRLADRVLPALGVDLPTLRRLHGTGLLLRDRKGLVFRHELARRAVESTIPAGGLSYLHGRLLDALERIEPQDPAVLTHHAVAAEDPVRAARHARSAAREAARVGSHTEAAAFLETALTYLPASATGERAELLTRLAHEQYMTSRLGAAIETVSATFPLWREAGDQAGLSAAHDSCEVFEYYNARRPRAERHAERAIALAGTAGGALHAAARVTRAYLALQRSDYNLALACCAEGRQVADEVGDEALRLRSEVFEAATELALGLPGARERLVALIEETGRHHDLDELTSTAYSHLAYLDVEQRRLGAAERVLEESLPFSVQRDIPICNHWQTGVRSRLRLVTGRWEAALEDARDVLDRTGMPLARVFPLLISGLIPLRRTGAGDGPLEDAWALADALDEPLRRLPVLTALAERMWLTGQPDERIATLAPALVAEVAGAPATAWSAGEVAVWLDRLGLPTPRPWSAGDGAEPVSGPAEPFRRLLAGDAEGAAQWWRESGSPFDEAMALAASAEAQQQARGIEQLDLLGATAVADRWRQILRERGAAVPARPRASTRANPSGLTNRQLDVAKLMARGLTNAEIAHRLFISPKTTDHHVSAVLLKLDLPNRRAVQARASDLGLA